MDLLARAIEYLENHEGIKIRVVDQGAGGVPLPDAELDYQGRRCSLEVECSTIRTKPDQVVKNLEKARAEGTPCLFVVPSEDLADRLLQLLKTRVPDTVLQRDLSVYFRDEHGCFVQETRDEVWGLFEPPAQDVGRCLEPSPANSSMGQPDLHEELIRVLPGFVKSSVDEVSVAEVRGRLPPDLLKGLPGNERAQQTMIGQAAMELGVPSRRGWRGTTRVTLYQLKDWHPVEIPRTNLPGPAPTGSTTGASAAAAGR